jgi:hypothetical protein
MLSCYDRLNPWRRRRVAAEPLPCSVICIEAPSMLEEIYTIFECTSKVHRPVISWAISGMRIR